MVNTTAPGAQWWYPSAMDNAMQSMQNASAVCIGDIERLLVVLSLGIELGVRKVALGCLFVRG